MKRFTKAVIGAILIAVGIIGVLNVFGLTQMSFSLDGWWTLFIIVPCLNGVLTSKDKLGNLAGLCIGILLLLAAQGVFGYGTVWKTVVPIIVIALGLKLVLCAFFPVKDKKSEEPSQKSLSLFTSETVDYTDEEISVAKLGAIFGGTKCNLADAVIKDGGKIDLLCVFGGAELALPENVNIEVNTFCLFGGISDKRTVKGGVNGPTVRINGFCLFGGADIK